MDNPMDFIYPGNQTTTILVPVDLNGKRQRVVFSAVHRDTQATLFWHLDDHYLGQTSGPHEMEVLPSPGTHLLTIVDNKGNHLARTFKVPDLSLGKH
jgi:penicillin-binding protein 1C